MNKRQGEMLSEYLLPGETLQKVADGYGVTRERVRAILETFFKDGGIENLTAGDLKKTLKRRCVVCGDPISKHIRGMYCDEECKSLARYFDFQDEKICKNCGKPFFPLMIWKHRKIKSRSSRECCCVKCEMQYKKFSKDSKATKIVSKKGTDE